MADGVDKRRKGGITTAIEIVAHTTNPEFAVNRSHSTLKKDAVRFRPVFVFLYLLYIEGVDMRPLNIRRTEFAKKALELLAAPSGPIRIAERYADVCARLAGQNYKLPSLRVDESITPQKMPVAPLPADVMAKIIKNKRA